MPSWTNAAARVLAWLVVAMQTLFGAAEVFAPRCVFAGVLANYELTHESSVWLETEKVARNMGLYNWFLALGLLLSLRGHLGGPSTSRFFLLCVAVAGAFGWVSVGSPIVMSIPFIAQLVFGLVTLGLFFQRS